MINEYRDAYLHGDYEAVCVVSWVEAPGWQQLSRRVENFAHRAKIEQGVRRDQMFLGSIGPSEIEEEGLAIHTELQPHRRLRV